MSSAEFSGMGLAIEPVRGVRAFEVDTLGRLTGVTYKSVWRPGENTSECKRLSADDPASGFWAAYNKGLLGPGSARRFVTASPMSPVLSSDPGETERSHDMTKCKCGFYAYYDGSNDYHTPDRINAVVEGWGQTVIGTRGFRAEKARILALHIPGSKPAKPTLSRWDRLMKWLYDHRDVTAAVFVAGFMVAGVLALLATSLVASYSDPRALLLLIPAALGGVSAWLCSKSLDWASQQRYRQTIHKYFEANLPAALVEKVRRNYPDVPVFDTFEAMVKAFPPDKGQEPSPETDPDFWTRTVA